MKNIFLLCILGFSPNLVLACDLKTVSQIQKALESNKKVLILAWSNKDQCGDEDEACGDWADRLNNFSVEQQKNLKIFKISKTQWPQVLKVPSTAPKQSALFLYHKHSSYFHEGPILDYVVYQAILDAWADKKDSPNTQYLPKELTAALCH